MRNKKDATSVARASRESVHTADVSFDGTEALPVNTRLIRFVLDSARNRLAALKRRLLTEELRVGLAKAISLSYQPVQILSFRNSLRRVY